MGKIDDVLERAIDKSLNHNNTFDVFKWIDNKDELKQSLYKAIESIVNECESFPMAHVGAISIENYQDENYCIKKQELLEKLKKEFESP